MPALSVADMESNEHHQPVPRPKAIPSHLINGHSPLHPAYSSERDHEDRNHTFDSIKASMGRHREPLSLDQLDLDAEGSSETRSAPRKSSARQYEHVQDGDLDKLDVKVAARDTRDEAPPTPPINSRSQSPFTANPTIDFDGLSWPSVGTLSRLRERESHEQAQARLDKLSGAVRTILECIGEDPDREGLHGTPERYAKAMMFFTKGYEENLRDIVNGAVFHEDHDELVIVKDIEVYSLCEHHLVPFTGKVRLFTVGCWWRGLTDADAYRLYSVEKSDRFVEAGEDRGDV